MKLFDRDATKWTGMGLLLVLFVVAAYLPGLHGGFIFDDYPNIIDNARVKLEHFTANGLSSAAFSSGRATAASASSRSATMTIRCSRI